MASTGRAHPRGSVIARRAARTPTRQPGSRQAGLDASLPPVAGLGNSGPERGQPTRVRARTPDDPGRQKPVSYGPMTRASMAGAMQPYALTLDRFIDHAAKWHGSTEVVTGGGNALSARTTYAVLRDRSAR